MKLISQAKLLLLSMTHLQVLWELTFIAVLVQHLDKKLWLPRRFAQGSSLFAISVVKEPVVANFPVKSPAGSGHSNWQLSSNQFCLPQTGSDVNGCGSPWWRRKIEHFWWMLKYHQTCSLLMCRATLCCSLAPTRPQHSQRKFVKVDWLLEHTFVILVWIPLCESLCGNDHSKNGGIFI